MKNPFELNKKELLQSHQLQVAEYWNNKLEGRVDNDTPSDKNNQIKKKKSKKWSLTNGITLYSWQEECIEKYWQKKQGIAKVVTGAGKTLFALALAQKMQNELKPDLKVLIVVPTIVLLNQWYDILIKHSNLPVENIGRLGGGYTDDLENKDILIAVNNSAVLKLSPVVKDQYQDRLFMIVDECHRLRGEVMRKVFEIKRAYSLGLSATPDVENPRVLVSDEDDVSQEDAPVMEDIITQELGDIFYTLSYDDAVKAGFLPEFEIQHIGLPLIDDETTAYRKVSDEITDLRDRLLDSVPDAPRGGELSGWASMKLNRPSTPDFIKSLCAGYVAKVAERKTLLFQAKSREKAVLRLINDRLRQNRKTQIILFHERIEEVMRLYALLWRNGIAAVPEHSQLPDSLRDKSIELFRHGLAKVIVSGKALIEGFDAPAADIGINAASSGSRVKAIQSIGRVLRKNDKDQDKTGLIVRFYITGTTDEFMYKKTDFAKITGAKRNRYFTWNPFDEAVEMTACEQFKPPFSPLPKESDLDWNTISIGDLLEFDADGQDYQIDNNGNLYTKKDSKNYVQNAQNVLDLIAPYRETMRNNYLTQTTQGRILLRCHDEEKDLWQWRYCGKTDELFNVAKEDITTQITTEQFKLKMFRGNMVIQQARIVNGVAKNIQEPWRTQVLSGIEQQQLENIKTIFITDGLRAFCRVNNQEITICNFEHKMKL